MPRTSRQIALSLLPGSSASANVLESSGTDDFSLNIPPALKVPVLQDRHIRYHIGDCGDVRPLLAMSWLAPEFHGSECAVPAAVLCPLPSLGVLRWSIAVVPSELVCSDGPCDIAFGRLVMGGGDEIERGAAIVGRLPDSYRKIVCSE